MYLWFGGFGPGYRSCHFSDSALQKDVIQTLAITIVMEGIACSVYSIWRKKPIRPILLSSLLGNIVTQSLLWLALTLFFQHYLVTLLISEILICLMEAMLYHGVRWNNLSMGDALFLSFITNLSSFAIGWFMPT